MTPTPRTVIETTSIQTENQTSFAAIGGAVGGTVFMICCVTVLVREIERRRKRELRLRNARIAASRRTVYEPNFSYQMR
jgi:hypothetical protein